MEEVTEVSVEEEVLSEELTEEKQKKFGYDKKENKFFIGKFRIKKKWAILVLIILIIIALFAGCNISAKKKMKEAMAPKDVAVERMTISKMVTGSSVIKPKDSYSIMTITTGEVIADYINEGDLVNKGDKLYQFDPETPQNSVKSAKNSVEKAQRAYNDALKAVQDLSVKSTMSGIVAEVFVNEGDSVQNGGKIATVYNDQYMKVRVPFNEVDAQNIYVGSGATLTVVGTGNELWGTVTEISSGSVSTADHNNVRYVTIETANPGALTTNDKATAMIGEVACNDAGTFEYVNKKTITSQTSGKVLSLDISANDHVYNGQVVAKLESSSAQTSLKNAELSLDDAKLSLEKAEKNLNDYTVTAPISGTVVTKNAKAGDKIDSSNAQTAMCIIYDMSSVQFDIEVDETEVASVKVGQSVTVTADAISGEVFNGVVEKVSVDGISENGVTSYPVTIAIAEYGGLLPGMNVDAEIIVEEAPNVLAIPVSSLNRGNVVFVKDDGSDKAENKEIPQKRADTKSAKKNDTPSVEAPEGYRAVIVTTGISDDNYIEIKSGLNEGDLVRGAELDMTSGLEKMMQQHMQGGGMPAGGGGMPGGGAQGGGARNGGGQMPR